VHVRGVVCGFYVSAKVLLVSFRCEFNRGMVCIHICNELV